MSRQSPICLASCHVSTAPFCWSWVEEIFSRTLVHVFQVAETAYFYLATSLKPYAYLCYCFLFNCVVYSLHADTESKLACRVGYSRSNFIGREPCLQKHSKYCCLSHKCLLIIWPASLYFPCSFPVSAAWDQACHWALERWLLTAHQLVSVVLFL